MLDAFLDAVFPIFRGGRRRIRLWLHALPGDAADVGRLIAHHGLVVRADVPIIYVIAEDDQNVRFFSRLTCLVLFDSHRKLRNIALADSAN